MVTQAMETSFRCKVSVVRVAKNACGTIVVITPHDDTINVNKIKHLSISGPPGMGPRLTPPRGPGGGPMGPMVPGPMYGPMRGPPPGPPGGSMPPLSSMGPGGPGPGPGQRPSWPPSTMSPYGQGSPGYVGPGPPTGGPGTPIIPSPGHGPDSDQMYMMKNVPNSMAGVIFQLLNFSMVSE